MDFPWNRQRSDSVKPCHTVQLHRLKMSAGSVRNAEHQLFYSGRKQPWSCPLWLPSLSFLGLLFAKAHSYQGKRHTVLGPVSIAALILIGLPITTQAAQSSNILASYFANIAQGYSDYGFVYGFSTSVVGRGMDKPEDYSEETVDAINTLVDSASSPTTVSTGSEPNIICVLLESFCDPYEVNFLNMSRRSDSEFPQP